jgi:hypothetical protein
VVSSINILGLVNLLTIIIGSMLCPICKRPLQQTDQDLILVFLCGHMVHAHCTSGGSGLPKPINSSLVGAGLVVGRDIGAKIA